MLRSVARTSSQPKVEPATLVSHTSPVYVEGYGFVPPSQVAPSSSSRVPATNSKELSRESGGSELPVWLCRTLRCLVVPPQTPICCSPEDCSLPRQCLDLQRCRTLPGCAWARVSQQHTTSCRNSFLPDSTSLQLFLDTSTVQVSSHSSSCSNSQFCCSSSSSNKSSSSRLSSQPAWYA